MRRRASLALLLVGCTTPQPLVICHNANCAGEVRVERDDTVEALRASLGLTVAGRPALDGVEIDSTWAGERCAFAHDARQASSAADAIAAAEVIAAHLLAADEPSWNGERFVLKIELKPSRDEDVVPHAGCALDVSEIVRAAARAAGHDLEVIFDSSSAGLLRAIEREPRWRTLTDARLSADFGAPRPLTPDTPTLAGFAGVALDVVELHAGWVTDAHLEAFRSMGLDLNLWSFSGTPEVLRAIAALEPRYVTSSEAELVRRWLDR